MPNYVKSLVISMVVVAFFLPTPVAAQQSNAAQGDWSRITSLAGGTNLSIKLKSGKRVKGNLVSVSDAGISMSGKDKPMELKREEIRSIYRVTSKSAKKSTLIGLAAGAGAGLAIGLAGSGDSGFDKIDQAATAGLTVIGAAGGALAGYLIGKGGSKQELIYQAQ